MFGTFLKIDGIPGESSDDAHKDWIEVLSFNHGITQPASPTASSAGGATTERCKHEPFTIVKNVDTASPRLYEACSAGKRLKNATIEMCRAGGDKLKYMEIRMDEIIVSHVAPGGISKGEGGFPTEAVSLAYGKIKWIYTQQKRADGSGGGNVTGGWDLIANKVSP